jgi:hypothetical protein
MDPLSFDLEGAVRAGRDRTTTDAAATARRVGQGGSAGLETAMSHSAEHELFTEALLAAARARFAEIKTVTK